MKIVFLEKLHDWNDQYEKLEHEPLLNAEDKFELFAPE